jgi:predicted nuclease of restriction endonuclease-like (RecB) superfamily
VSRNFNTPDFQLSWTHYLFLIKIDNISERKVYEIEAINNNWSVKELQRQFNSALFESLVFSKNKKKEIKKLSEKGTNS